MTTTLQFAFSENLTNHRCERADMDISLNLINNEGFRFLKLIVRSSSSTNVKLDFLTVVKTGTETQYPLDCALGDPKSCNIMNLPPQSHTVNSGGYEIRSKRRYFKECIGYYKISTPKMVHDPLHCQLQYSITTK